LRAEGFESRISSFRKTPKKPAPQIENLQKAPLKKRMTKVTNRGFGVPNLKTTALRQSKFPARRPGVIARAAKPGQRPQK
jgi:hypothetical protein